mmetsp:Transcript_4316/g.13032  ORF Transcript_4316/g.13032 Transcript_4316/m.13032 type:complete len:239 (+) Transcript_4316:581-1297(+)
MVERCNAAGVTVYVDAVINHMTGVGSGRGYAGSTYSEYSYPAVPYDSSDFHFCGRNEGNDIRNYGDAYEVRNCELVNLADLRTESSRVQDRIAAFMSDLTGIGVGGFRIDAAKHMPPGDISSVLSRVGGDFKVFQEVIAQSSSEPITAAEYFDVAEGARVTEFRYGLLVSEHVRTSGKLHTLRTFGESWGLMPSEKAVVFVDNHDNQRGHGGGGVGSLGCIHGTATRLATAALKLCSL